MVLPGQPVRALERHLDGDAARRRRDRFAERRRPEIALRATGAPLARAGITQPRIQIDGALAALLGASGRRFNDDFRDAVALTGISGSVTGANIDATAQRNEPVHAGVGGGKSVWWRWRAPASGDTMIATVRSDFDTVLAVYRGGRLHNLREIASNDDGEGLGLQSMVRFDAQAGINYRIAVDGFNGAEGNITLMFANLAALPATVATAGDATPRDPARELWSAVAKYARLD